MDEAATTSSAAVADPPPPAEQHHELHPALRAVNQLLYLPSSHVLLSAFDANPLMTEWVSESVRRRPPPSWAQPDELHDEDDSILHIRNFSRITTKLIRLLFPRLGEASSEVQADPSRSMKGITSSFESSSRLAPEVSSPFSVHPDGDAEDNADTEKNIDGSVKTLEDEQSAIIHDLHEAIKKMQAEHEADRNADQLLHHTQLRQERKQSAIADAARSMQNIRKETLTNSQQPKSSDGPDSPSGFMAHQSDLMDLIKQRNAQKAAMELAQRELVIANEQLIAKTAKIDELEKLADALEVAFKAMQSIHDNLKSTSETALVTATLQSEGKLTEANRRLAFQSDWLLTATNSIKSVERSHRVEVEKLNEMHAKAAAEMKGKIEQLLTDRAGLIEDMIKLRDDRNKLSLIVSDSLSHLTSQQAAFTESLRGTRRSIVVNAAAPSTPNPPVPPRVEALLRAVPQWHTASFLAQEIAKVPLLIVQGGKMGKSSASIRGRPNSASAATSSQCAQGKGLSSSVTLGKDGVGMKPPRPPSSPRSGQKGLPL